MTRQPLGLPLDIGGKDVEIDGRPGRKRKGRPIAPSVGHGAIRIAGPVRLEPADHRAFSAKVKAVPEQNTQIQGFEKTGIEFGAEHGHRNPGRPRGGVRKNAAMRWRHRAAVQRRARRLHLLPAEQRQPMPQAIDPPRIDAGGCKPRPKKRHGALCVFGQYRDLLKLMRPQLVR